MGRKLASKSARADEPSPAPSQLLLYLLDQFLSEGVNVRADRYGGSVRSRLGLAIEVVEAARAAVGDDFVVGIRSSQGKVNDFVHKWQGLEEAATIYQILGRLPLDYLHTTEFEAWQPAFAEGSGLAALAKRHGGQHVLANGSLHDPDRAIDLRSRRSGSGIPRARCPDSCRLAVSGSGQL